MSRFNHGHLQLVPVPIPDRVAAVIGSQLPIHILQAEYDADGEAREVLRFRGPLCHEDQADREFALSRLARANKVLGKHHPLLPITPKQVAS